MNGTCRNCIPNYNLTYNNSDYICVSVSQGNNSNITNNSSNSSNTTNITNLTNISTTNFSNTSNLTNMSNNSYCNHTNTSNSSNFSIASNGSNSSNASNASYTSNSSNSSNASDGANSSNASNLTNTSGSNNSSSPIIVIKPNKTIEDEDKLVPESVKVISDVIQTTTATIVGSAVPAMLLGGDPTLMWGLANLMQLFYYLLFYNIKYPANLANFLEVFSIGRLDFIPNPFQGFVDDETENRLLSPKNFYENGFTGLFIHSCGTFIAINMMMICAYIGSKIMLQLTKKQVFKKFVSFFEWSGLLRNIFPAYLELVIGACLQLRVMQYNNYTQSISSIFAAVSFILSIVIPIKIFTILKNITREKKNDDIEKYRAITEDYDLSHEIACYYSVFILLKRFVHGVGIVFLYDMPLLQILSSWIPNFMILILIMLYRPHHRMILNLIDIFTEISFLIIHSIIFAFGYYQSTNIEISSQLRNNLGFIIIASCIGVLGLNLILMIKEQLIAFYKGYQFIKNLFIRKKLKVSPKKTQKFRAINRVKPIKRRLN